MGIYIGNTEVSTIYIGYTNPSAVYLGNNQVYPDDYYYTLTFNSVSYSSGSSLLASGSNYITMTGTYKRIRRSTGSVISSQTVNLTPSASYCKVVGLKMYFDYDQYKATTVASGSKSVMGSYNGLTCYGSFTFQGNSLSTTYSIGAFTVGQYSFPAKGGETTISGGEISKHERWTSGYRIDSSTSYYATFTGSCHSETDLFQLDIYEDEVSVPSLSSTAVAAGTYTITASYPGATDTYVTINQDRNYIVSTTRTFSFYHDGAEIDSIDVMADTSIYVFTASLLVKNTYASEYVQNNPVPASYLTASYENEEGENYPITGITRTSSGWRILIANNTTENYRYADVILTYSNYSGYISFEQQGNVITYALENCALTLSSGSQLLTNTSNYAMITGDYVEYHGGTEYSRTRNVVCTPVIASSSSSLSQYFNISSNNIYFNKAVYGKTDMTATLGSSFNTTWNCQYNGTTSYPGLSLTTQSNAVTNTSSSINLSLLVSPTSLQSIGGTVTLTPTLSTTTITYYNSGEADTTTSHAGSIELYRNNVLIGTTTHGVSVQNTVSSTLIARILTYKAKYNGYTSIQTVVQEGNVPEPVYATLCMSDPERCIGCSACDSPLSVCPYNIRVDNGTIINADACIDCNACFDNGLNDSCPVEITFYVENNMIPLT